MAIHFDQKDKRAYTYFVKLPEIEHKFAIGCKNLSSASVADIIELAKDVGKRTNYDYTAPHLIYCAEIDKMIADDTALAFCISKGYTFEVLNGVSDANRLPSIRNSRFPVPKLFVVKSKSF